MGHTWLNSVSDPRLQLLLRACFDKRPEIACEARHLARFFIEYKLVKHSSEQKEQYRAELTENEVFRREYGELNLFAGEFESPEISGFVQCLVNEFLDRPADRQGLVQVLKRAGSVNGIQETIVKFVKDNWRLDEFVADRALDIIWDLKLLSQLEETFFEIMETAREEVLRDHASQLLGLLEK